MKLRISSVEVTVFAGTAGSAARVRSPRPLESTLHRFSAPIRRGRQHAEIRLRNHGPCGSRETLAAALQAGADSVYFGIGALNMRAHSAGGFTIDDLNEIAALCREHGAKSYLTVNTVIYDGDSPPCARSSRARLQASRPSSPPTLRSCSAQGARRRGAPLHAAQHRERRGPANFTRSSPTSSCSRAS